MMISFPFKIEEESYERLKKYVERRKPKVSIAHVVREAIEEFLARKDAERDE